MITFPFFRTIHFPLFVNSPICTARTPRESMSFLNVSKFFFGTESVIRSCDSEIQICHGDIPSYLSGTFSISTTAPPHSFAISATEQEIPPAPLSVILVYKSISRASFTIASESFFCVIGSPICTAVDGEEESSVTEENVAPCTPSSPTLPPTTTI